MGVVLRSAPKFPGTFIIQYLLRYHHSFNEPDALKQALLSLDKMIQEAFTTSWAADLPVTVRMPEVAGAAF